jgi:hypothetical protein
MPPPPGKPIPVSKVRAGDKIKITLEHDPCYVILPYQPHPGGVNTATGKVSPQTSHFIRVRWEYGNVSDLYFGPDHTVWRLE